VRGRPSCPAARAATGPARARGASLGHPAAAAGEPEAENGPSARKRKGRKEPEAAAGQGTGEMGSGRWRCARGATRIGAPRGRRGRLLDSSLQPDRRRVREAPGANAWRGQQQTKSADCVARCATGHLKAGPSPWLWPRVRLGPPRAPGKESRHRGREGARTQRRA